MINVVCVKYGDRYSSKIVNNLYKMARKNISSPISFICLTDDATGLDSGIKSIPLNEDLYLEGYWWKFCIFNPEIYKENRKTLYLDLDVIIQNDITYMFDLIQKNQITTCRSCEKENHRDEYKKHHSIINSSIMLFNSKEMKDVYDRFIENIDYNMLEYQGVCRFLYALFWDRLNYLEQFKDFYHFAQRPSGIPRDVVKSYSFYLSAKNGRWKCYYIKDSSIAILNRTSDFGFFKEAYSFFSNYYENL